MTVTSNGNGAAITWPAIENADKARGARMRLTVLQKQLKGTRGKIRTANLALQAAVQAALDAWKPTPEQLARTQANSALARATRAERELRHARKGSKRALALAETAANARAEAARLYRVADKADTAAAAPKAAPAKSAKPAPKPKAAPAPEPATAPEPAPEPARLYRPIRDARGRILRREPVLPPEPAPERTMRVKARVKARAQQGS